MSTELWCLVINALWGFLLVMIEITGKTQTAGPKWNQGNREKDREFPAWVGRTSRALANHQENFPLFLTGVVVLTFIGGSDALSRGACVVYVLARAAHGLIYIAGITRVRSAAFLTGLAATAALYVSIAW